MILCTQYSALRIIYLKMIIGIFDSSDSSVTDNIFIIIIVSIHFHIVLGMICETYNKNRFFRKEMYPCKEKILFYK